MFISTIIPTIGRPSLAKAVGSVLEQGFEYEECEVIVVNDSGEDLQSAEWQTLSSVKIISTNRLNRSIARNTGAAIATGRYLHFLDDDDWMLPGAFETFWEGAQKSPAAWIHGAFSMVDNSNNKIVDVFPDESGNCFLNLIAWEWLPLQASIVDADAFFSVGGFAMLNALKGGFEDIHLTRQIALTSNFLSMPNLVACIRSGDRGTTTNYSDIFIQNRQSREKNLDMPGSYQRLISSARDNQTRNGYWHGKIIYYLLSSAFKNFKDKRIFTAGSRIMHMLVSFFAAKKYLLQADFWNGVTKPHHPRAWLAIENSGQDLFKNTRWNINF